ncbi:MAG: general secretion pathway protein GspK [Deltaproteobacteria bacterium]|nr:general secretion pathway protein GspK [Deltaproteobacteria bacterium]
MLKNLVRPLKNPRGVALLVTLSVMTVLVAASLEYNRRARFDLISSAAARDQLTMTEMAKAGVQVAMAILAKDRAENDTDTLMDEWADPVKIEEVLRDFPFEDGGLTLAIRDEMGKIQVNALVNFPEGRQFNEPQRQLWERLLQYFADRSKELKLDLRDDGQPTAIINSLKDWLDSGDDDAITGLTGAESSYYNDREPPYPARNGPVQDLDELLFVKGITPELFYGQPEIPGLSGTLTVHGATLGEGTGFTFPGRINIATAELPVLFALVPAENNDLVETLDELRRDMVSGKQTVNMKNPNWLTQIPGLADLKLDAKLIAASSDVFRVESTATLHDAGVTITAVVQRVQTSKAGKWTCRILSWQVG